MADVTQNGLSPVESEVTQFTFLEADKPASRKVL
jgi:hypothetical protein